MKLCLRLLLPAGVLLVVLGTIAAACGSADEEPTLEEFFQRFQAIGDDFDERAERLEDEFPARTDSLPARKASYRGYTVLFAEFYDELETLNPPSLAEDAFDELLTTGRELVEVVEETDERIEGAKSMDDVYRILEVGAADFNAVDQRHQDACQSLREFSSWVGYSFSCNLWVGSSRD